jgi:hypothetical protein
VQRTAAEQIVLLGGFQYGNQYLCVLSAPFGTLGSISLRPYPNLFHAFYEDLVSRLGGAEA